jgi:hypothetical protein
LQEEALQGLARRRREDREMDDQFRAMLSKDKREPARILLGFSGDMRRLSADRTRAREINEKSRKLSRIREYLILCLKKKGRNEDPFQKVFCEESRLAEKPIGA